MNERIKELALQAEQYADDTMNADPATYDKAGQVKVWRELMQAKFAELIVRECASIAYRESCYSDPENVMGFDISKKIEEHFGVEE